MLSFFFFKQKTAYEMRISDWSSDVCSSDLTKPITPSSEANSEGRAAGGVGGVRMDGELASHAAGHDGGLPFAATRAHCDTPYAGWGCSAAASSILRSSQERSSLCDCASLNSPKSSNSESGVSPFPNSRSEERSEERRVGKACVSTGRFRVLPEP